MNRRSFLASLPVASALAREKPALDAALHAIAPGVKKWASVCVVTGPAEAPVFTWHDYAGTADKTDFWPASCIKLYTLVAALELAEEKGWPLDATLTFSHQDKAGAWHVDAARTLREMLSEVCRRSSNEDYTLLLRLVGIDRINTQLLVPERGFPHSALMRGYVAERPWKYVREEPQRILATLPSGATQTLEHTWSGKSYSAERGCTIIDAQTGNVTSPRELADCMRRILFHHQLPQQERFKISAEAVAALLAPEDGFVGLETRDAASGASAWSKALELDAPKARYFHKCGLISNYALETFYLDDSGGSGLRFIAVPVVELGHATSPKGEPIVGQMAQAIFAWLKP